MNCAWRRTVPAGKDAIEDGVVFDHCRVSTAANQPAALRARAGAVAWLEEYLQRGLVTQTWEYAQDDFTNVMRLPMAAPLQSVESVEYYNESGTLVELAESVYLEDLLSEPGRLCLAPQQVWPTVQTGRPLAVLITYVVGWEPAAIPADIMDGLYLLIGDRYGHREQTITGTTSTTVLDVSRMLAGRRVWLPPVNACEPVVPALTGGRS